MHDPRPTNAMVRTPAGRRGLECALEWALEMRVGRGGCGGGATIVGRVVRRMRRTFQPHKGSGACGVKNAEG